MKMVYSVFGRSQLMSETYQCSDNLGLLMLRGAPQEHRYLVAVKWAPGYHVQFPTNRRLTTTIRKACKKKDFSIAFGEKRLILTITVSKALSIAERQKLIAAIDAVTTVAYTPPGPYD
jgi:hypothetical protein